MSPLQTILVLAAMPVALCSTADIPPVHPVLTDAGPVLPVLEYSRAGRPYYAVRGIPYARPPIGRLRFADPQRPTPWVYVRGSMAIEPLCSQYNIFIEDPSNRLLGQEDCLYLSVFTPNMGGLKMPVMVYMHEGGFHFGGGSTFHGPQFFMDRNVVLVMFNYRLGAHGFLSFEDDWLPGNYGLKDQQMALKWVQANIENFGGDPKSVTIFGQSAGGSSVHYHMISTKSRGLFSRAIVQSGNAMSPWALIPKGLARSRAILASERLGCPTDGRTTDDLLGCLRNVTARDLAAVHESFLEWHTDPSSVFGPVVEGDRECSFLTVDPFTVQTPNIPLMAGYTTAEANIKVAAMDRYGGLTTIGNEFDQLIPTILLYKYTATNPGALTKEIRQFYFDSKTIGPNTSTNITNMISDCWIIHPISEMISKHQGPAYLYEFDYVGQTSFLDLYNGRKFATGPAHCDDLLYLFNMSAQVPQHTFEPKDVSISESMVMLWTNFAKYGNPTPWTEGRVWTPFSKNNEHLHIFKGGLSMEKEQMSERKLFWKNLIVRDAITSGDG